MIPLRSAISVAEAQHKLLSHIVQLPTETLELAQSFGRRMAHDLYSKHPVPHFVKSGMDGFAVRSEDIGGASVDQPVTLKVTQCVAAGGMPTGPIGKGEAARIMTGAVLPVGADTVVMFEMTEQPNATSVLIKKAVEQGKNVSFVGDEIRERERLIQKGVRMGAGEAALFAMFGCHQVEVYRKPKVSLFSTGDELLPIHAPLEPGKIRNSNLYMILALLHEAGVEVIEAHTLKDQMDATHRAIRKAMETSDIVITTGGVSVGDFDIMTRIFNEWDGELLFNKVMMRPGTVTTSAVKGNCLLFGLSGNPSACFVGYHLFVHPALLALQGVPDPLPKSIPATLKGNFSKGNVYPRYITGTRSFADGCVYAEVNGRNQSSVTRTIPGSDCLLVIPPGGAGLKDGDRVYAIDLFT